MWTQVRDEVIKLLQNKGMRCARLRGSLYRLQNGKLVWIKYSGVRRSGRSLRYWFGIPEEEFLSHPAAKLFVLFICGSEKRVLVIPATLLAEMLRDVDTAVDGAWKMDVYEKQGSFEILVTGKPRRDLTAYLNRYELLQEREEGKRTEAEGVAEGVEKVLSASDSRMVPSDTKCERKRLALWMCRPLCWLRSVIDRVWSWRGEYHYEETSRYSQERGKAAEGGVVAPRGVKGSVLHHGQLVNMVVQVGEWMGYKAVPRYRIHPSVSHRVDVAWLRDDAIHIAVEIVGEDLDKVGERLALARRFGARKCIAVVDSNSMDGLMKIFGSEGEARHWVEIWSSEKVYNMFASGRDFFEIFKEFDRHQYRDDIAKVV